MESEKRILVVDDDDAIRALLSTVLRRRGQKVDTARNGVEALERLQACRYSLVLLDLMMPRMNGYDVMARLAEEPSHARPIVIVLTAGSEPRALDPALVSALVRKPFDIGLLLDTLSGALATCPPQEQSPQCPPDGGEPVPGSTREPN